MTDKEKGKKKGSSSVWLVAGIGVLLLFLVFLGWYDRLTVYEIDEPITATPSDCGTGTTRFAVIGDYGEAGEPLADVSAMINRWDVDFIVTAGDNNYADGEASTIDENIGQYFHEYIYPYKGTYGPGAEENRFWPTLGNHDWRADKAQPYLDYFTLPGNERYYDFEEGPVHFFMLDSDPNEPDGNSTNSLQAGWLQERLLNDDSPWRLVVLHHPPYTSSLFRGGTEELEWPFARWGVSAILGGHEHFYEGGYADGIPQFIVGISGRWGGTSVPIDHFHFRPTPGSRVRYNQDYGAMLVTADDTCMNFTFYNRQDEVIDSYTMRK